MKTADYETVCAVCYQPMGENCRARLDGRHLSVRHFAEKPRAVRMLADEAQALRKHFAFFWGGKKAASEAQTTKGERVGKSLVPFGEQCVAKGGLALGEPNPSLDRYNRNHERFGDISIAELTRIGISAPQLLRRPD